MSKLQVQGNASGSGVITLEAPNTNSDVTLSLPAATGEVLTTATAGVPIGGPAFSAYQSSAQTLASNTTTKLLFQTETFDTNNNFDSSRFTPTVAGYYQITANFYVSASYTTGSVSFYKNGSIYQSGGGNSASPSGTANGWQATCLVFLNGTTDYIEAYGIVATGQALTAGASVTYFQGCLVRSAT